MNNNTTKAKLKKYMENYFSPKQAMFTDTLYSSGALQLQNIS